MKKALIGALVVIFMLAAIMAVADEKCNKPCPAGVSKTADKTAMGCAKASSDKTTAGCCAKSAKATATSVSAINAGEEVKKEAGETPIATTDAKAPEAATEKIAEGACPDVTGKSSLEVFHNTMHPMHMALEESKYDEIRTLMPAMDKSAKDLKAYQCPMEDKCPPDCKKEFNKKKSELLNSVKKLNKACGKKDNAKLETAFMTVHENYIKFASMCTMKSQEEEAKPESK